LLSLLKKESVVLKMSAVPKPRISVKILVFTALGLLTLVVYFYYFVGTVNVTSVIERTNLFYYTFAFVAFLVSVLFSTLAWRGLLKGLGVKITVQRALLFMWAGMFFDATVPDPGWSGDLSRAYMLAKTSNLDTGRIAASVVGQKIISLVITVIDLLLGLALLSWNYTLPGIVLVFIAAVSFLSIFSLFVVCYLSAKPKATKTILDSLIRTALFLRRGRWDPQDFRLKAENMLNKYHEGIRTLGTNLKVLVQPVMFALISWGFEVSITFITFASTGHRVPVDKVLIVYALTGSLQAIGVAFVGFTEFIMSGSYALLGIPSAEGLLATLLTRVVTLWFKLAVAYLAFQWAGIAILRRREQSAVQQNRLPVSVETKPQAG
jgi:uncharacterized protein (TIRG00374 family)